METVEETILRLLKDSPDGLPDSSLKKELKGIPDDERATALYNLAANLRV
jgi:hypothetical protein